MRGRFLVISSTSLELALIPPQDEMNLRAGRCRSCTSTGRTASHPTARPPGRHRPRSARAGRARGAWGGRTRNREPAGARAVTPPCAAPPLHTPPPAAGARGRCGTGRARLGEGRAWPPSPHGGPVLPSPPVSRCPSLRWPLRGARWGNYRHAG